MEVLLCERVNDLRHSLFHLLHCLESTASELRDLPKVTGSKVWTIGRAGNCLDAHLAQNSLWQGWSGGLVHRPDGNATDLIWRVLATSDRISSWTPVKPQHSNPKPNPLVYWLPYSSHTSYHPSQTPWLPWISYATQKLMLNSCKMVEKQSEAFHTFLWHFFQV